MENLYKAAEAVVNEVKKAVVGKEEEIELIMTAIVAGGHILIEDTPGVGKTTMAVSFSKAMGLMDKRVQFTPDVMPADLTGFSIYQKETNSFVYQPGAVMCNLFLADEINRTSPKTQSALLEVMEEGKVTVDGITRETGRPFIVLATQNPVGSAGTQLLPESQLDRFMICISLGYPTVKEEMQIIKRRQQGSLIDNVETIINGDVLIAMQQSSNKVFIHDAVMEYMAKLVKATRENELLEVGMSPRGTVAIAAMSRATAWLQGRNYVTPDDVKKVFPNVAAHRVALNTKAKVGHVKKEEVLKNIMAQTLEPKMRKQ